MKNSFFAIAIAAVLLTGAVSSPAFGQSVQISVETDRDKYVPGDTINISGTVSKLISGTPVTIQLTSNGNVLSVGQISLEEDSTWSHQIKLSAKTKAGEYTISVLYGNWKNQATFTIGHGVATQPPQITEAAKVGNIDDKDALVYKFEEVGIDYKIVGGSIVAIYPDIESNSLIIKIDATDDGMLTISLPREVIDSEGDGPLDGEFFILLDNEQIDFEEIETTDTHRTLNIKFFASSDIIEIIGTRVIPEFGVVAIVVLAVALTSIIAITSRSKMSQIVGL